MPAQVATVPGMPSSHPVRVATDDDLEAAAAVRARANPDRIITAEGMRLAVEGAWTREAGIGFNNYASWLWLMRGADEALPVYREGIDFAQRRVQVDLPPGLDLDEPTRDAVNRAAAAAALATEAPPAAKA